MRAWVGLAFVVFYHIQVDKSNPSAEKITKNTHTHTAVAVGSREADLRSRGRKHAHVKKPNFFASVFIFLHSQASLHFSFCFFFVFEKNVYSWQNFFVYTFSDSFLCRRWTYNNAATLLRFCRLIGLPYTYSFRSEIPKYCMHNNGTKTSEPQNIP